MKWVRGKTKRLAKGYSVTVYTAEGTSAIIVMRTYAFLGTRSMVLFSTIYNGQTCVGFMTFRGAKKYIEQKLKLNGEPVKEANVNG